MIRALALGTFFVAMLAGCGTTDSQAAQPADLGAEVTLAPGASASFKSSNVIVQFMGVTKDSRCPRGTTCMWAGDVTVLLSIRSPRQSPVRYEVMEGERVIAGDYLITVVKVLPEPVASARIPQESYRATLQLQKL
jgi:predicted deacylase